MTNRQSKFGDQEATYFSPQAQAVLDAANKAYWLWDEMCPADAGTIAAAALNAVADQVVPPDPDRPGRWDRADEIRFQILAIATELENA